jgi:hypothetical protein
LFAIFTPLKSGGKFILPPLYIFESTLIEPYPAKIQDKKRARFVDYCADPQIGLLLTSVAHHIPQMSEQSGK